MTNSDPHRPLPVLTAGTPVLAREDGSLHIGWDPSSALIVHLDPPAVTESVARLLDELRRPITRAELGGRVRAAGLTASSFTGLLDRLVAAGKARDPASDDSGLRVRIHGDGVLARLLAEGLCTAGIPVIDDRLRAAAMSRRLDCNLMLLADRPLVDPAVRLALMAARTPHLPVGLAGGAGVIGPLVLPGLTGCLQCADLHRAELDPEWPVLAARLNSAAGGADPETTAVTAALAVQEIQSLAARLADPRGTPPQIVDHQLRVHSHPAGTSLLEAPPHPGCPCRGQSPHPGFLYPRGRRKDCVERHHTWSGAPQCQTGGAAARHGGTGRGRPRQTTGR
ncbi:MAG: TOMM precursor leader peptide-binding protein [Gordonia sp. (in: high G+C Gram-positive bacteria)]|uniref:TOMM precursor leader peptide-binding protein n=1 Tax=Gordonia sp. (in: high G+C Gram-positive bacteria) TaxID=84139 RepID=UPI0039E47A8B